jgi:hypothetical protein
LGTVTIDVTAVNDAPVLTNGFLSIDNQAVVAISGDSILSNATDVDGDSLTIVEISAPLFGTLTDSGDGSYIYTPQTGFVGLDRFSYTVADPSGAQATAVIYVNVQNNFPGNDPAPLLVSPTVDPQPPTDDPGPDSFDVTPAIGPDTTTPETQNSASATTVPAIAGGHGGTLAPAGIGDPGLSFSTPGLTTGTVWLDEMGDSSAKSKPQKFLYDGILDGFEFQGFGLKTVGINQEILWQALDDMQRQMSGLDESSNRSFLISSVTGGSGLLLTTGLISWVLRGGALASTLLSTVPLWRGVDPLPLLAGRKKKKKKEKAITDTQLIDRSQESDLSRTMIDAERMFADSAKPTDDSRGAE